MSNLTACSYLHGRHARCPNLKAALGISEITIKWVVAAISWRAENALRGLREVVKSGEKPLPVLPTGMGHQVPAHAALAEAATEPDAPHPSPSSICHMPDLWAPTRLLWACHLIRFFNLFLFVRLSW